jgi:hypothetical protein
MILEIINNDKDYKKRKFIDMADVLCIQAETTFIDFHGTPCYSLICQVAGQKQLFRLKGLYRGKEAEKRIEELIYLENLAECLERTVKI